MYFLEVMIMRNLLEIYNLEMRCENKAPATIKNANSRLTKFCDYIISLENLTKNNINQYIVSLNLSPRSVNEHIKTIRVFIKYLYNEGYIDKPIEIKAFKTDKVIQEEITDADVNKLLMSLKRDKSYFGVRNLTILSVLIDCGLRVSELCSLDVDDIGDTIKVKCKRKERLVPVSPKLRLQLMKYMRVRSSYVKDNNKALFISRNKNRISIISVQKLIEKLGKENGIKGLHTHSLRHYYIQSLLKQGVNIYYISSIVGHSNINTTETYLRSMNKNIIIDSVKDYSNL